MGLQKPGPANPLFSYSNICPDLPLSTLSQGCVMRTNSLVGALTAAAATSLLSCPTLCDPIDGSPPGSRPWESSGKNTGVGCHFLLQGIRPNPGMEPESPVSAALQADSLPAESLGKPPVCYLYYCRKKPLELHSSFIQSLSTLPMSSPMLCFRPKEEPVLVPVLRELTVVRSQKSSQ